MGLLLEDGVANIGSGGGRMAARTHHELQGCTETPISPEQAMLLSTYPVTYRPMRMGELYIIEGLCLI